MGKTVSKNKSKMICNWGLANPTMYYSYELYGLCSYKSSYDFRVYEDIMGFFDELFSSGISYEQLPMDIRYWYDFLIYEHNHPKVDEEYKDIILENTGSILERKLRQYRLGVEFSKTSLGRLTPVLKDDNLRYLLAVNIDDYWFTVDLNEKKPKKSKKSGKK